MKITASPIIKFVNYNQQSITMGNTQPLQLLPTCSTSKPKLQTFQLIRRISQGQSLMQNKHTKKYSIILQHTFPTEQQLNQYMKQHKINFSLTHQFYLNAYDCQVITQTNICSKQFRLAEYFQYQSHTLLNQIENRITPARNFTVKQIMSILCSCVLVLSYFNKNQILHYTLTPQDIIIDQAGICKVVSSSLSRYIFDFNQKKTFYYAPQTLRMLKQPSFTSGLTNKSGVFTLGITLLHMIHLRNMHHLYNFHSHTINFELLSEEIKMIDDANLRNIVKKMVKPQSYDRISFTELQEMLFQVISKSDKSLPTKEVYYETQHYHINKLEESILRLKNEQTAQSSITQNTKKYHSKQRELVCLQPNLQKDEEDIAELASSHTLITQEDTIVLDQFEHSIGLDYSQTIKNGAINKEVPNKDLLQKIVHSQRTLSQNQNYHNSVNIDIDSIYKQSKSYRDDKRNIAILFQSSMKRRQTDQYPEYVSQILKEGRYEGYKLGNQRHGFGTFYYNQGGKYCGQWVKNRMQGRGVLYYSSGKIAYQGEWKQDRLDGYGVLYNESIGVLREPFDYTHMERLNDQWIKYEGYFKDDVKLGQGTLFLSNGQSFHGQFQNDQPNGKGHFKNIRGEVIMGFWLMGALNLIQ